MERKLTKGEQTRNRILDVAEQNFASKGFKEASLREIADSVGIQEPGLYRHFESKEAIYRAVLDRALLPLQRLLEQQMAQGFERKTLIDLPSRVFELFLEHPYVALLFHQALVSEPDKSNPMHEWMNGLFKQARDIVKNVTNETLDIELLALRVLAVFNVCIGYFSSRPIMDILTDKGSKVSKQKKQKQLADKQKEILTGMMASWF